MAKRPVFIVNEMGDELITEKYIEFTWHSGFSISQKRKSISSLHENLLVQNQNLNVLEISTKSENQVGEMLSAFNLKIHNNSLKEKITVECAFQGSKVFEDGGPYIDVLNKNSREAKKDERLKNSGKLICFNYENDTWSLEPKTIFYDWLYLNAVNNDKNLREKIIKYNAFTDIEFNPNKSINCQAKSAALYVSLYKRKLLDEVLLDEKNFKNYFDKNINKKIQSNTNEVLQISMFDK